MCADIRPGKPPVWKSCVNPQGEPPKSRATTKIFAALRGAGSKHYRAVFLTYQTKSHRFCFDLFQGRVQPPECSENETCGPVCLVYLRNDDNGEAVFGGILPAADRTIRLRFNDGKDVTYSLDGPRLPQLPARRVFIADLGTEHYPRFTLAKRATR